MGSVFGAVKVSERVFWVGAIDWALSEFHGYRTDRGTTYNAYLVLADKITLTDTVKKPFFEEMLSRIASVVEPSQIDYIVSNHSEMDHSGSLPETVEVVKPEKIFASVMGQKALADHFHMDREIAAVKDGDTLSLGNLTLHFLETRMLHWPDSMFSYLAEEKLLFSQDAFGMHLATSERFADEIDDDVLRWEAARYYANILLLYSPLVTKLIERVRSLGLDIRTIAPDHGPVWRKEVMTPVEWYTEWARQEPTRKALVVYDTMWHSTEMMANAVAEGLAEGGASPKVMSLRASHRSDVATEVLDAGGLFVGSPTMNNNLYPTMADLLTYLRGLKPQNLLGAAFGSYGWSGEASRTISDTLSGMKVDVISEPIRVKYVPRAGDIEQCREMGKRGAAELLAKPDG